jgi:NAD(P)-dependent dehydrogenase (short-subunit alcohol dehydrogenase family)
MTEPVAVITGGNAGIGKEAAVALARAGWQVFITARDPGRGTAALEEITSRSSSTRVDVLSLDLADLASVRAFPDLLAGRTDQLDVLVNNAGLVLQDRRVTVDGFEQTFGVNHLGHFLLTDLLLDRLRANANGARVVVVSSRAHKMARRGLDFDDLQTEHHRYRGFSVYSRSKLANILFTRELARRLDGSDITVNSLHPGYVDSRFGRDGDTRRWFEIASRLGSFMAITPEVGAQTTVYLASSPDVDGITGEYFYKCRPAKVSSAALDDVAAARLWSASEILVGI